MLHVLTAHFGTSQWVEPQRACFEEYITEPYRVICSVERCEVSPPKHWEVIEQQGGHGEKLNELADWAGARADDVLLFIDGDALPGSDLSPVLRACRVGQRLVAIRRDENLADPQPHPSFCACPVRLWRDLPGDWTTGPNWINSAGFSVSDIGAKMWKRLEQQNIIWLPLLRTSNNPFHKLWFGVYGSFVYHHGAGFRLPISRGDFVTSERHGDSREEQDAWCAKHGVEMSRLGGEIFSRIIADPLRTMERCENGSLFHDLNFDKGESGV